MNLEGESLDVFIREFLHVNLVWILLLGLDFDLFEILIVEVRKGRNILLYALGTQTCDSPIIHDNFQVVDINFVLLFVEIGCLRMIEEMACCNL